MKNLTVNAMETLQKAQSKAYELSHAELEPLHLLWALLSETGLATNTLRGLELDPALIARTAEQELRSLPTVQHEDVPNASRELQQLLLEAAEAGQAPSGGMVGTRELLLALAADRGRAGSVLQDLRRHRRRSWPAPWSRPAPTRPTRATTRPASATARSRPWTRYARDLCAAARAGKIDPIIGRDEEIRRVIQILSRRTKNNPVLIGSPGVGKTAVAEGLARRLVEGDVPEGLQGQAPLRPGHGRPDRRHQVPRRVRGPPQEGHQGGHRAGGRGAAVHRRDAHPGRRRRHRAAPWTPRTSSSRPWPAASCTASAPRPSTSTASTSRRTRPWSGASSRCWSRSRPGSRPWPSCAA